MTDSIAFLLITYDIPNDCRRVRMHKLLTEFGVQVQESVFECELDAAAEKRLLRRPKTLTRPGDNIRIYSICAACRDKVRDAEGNRHAGSPDVYFG